ncbi:hypothetical protein [Nitratireductor basaltis]|uniref:Uncharacterized protein n=1 Tax=Nitratireductor basaltis TaxID=472175 RepID=A0A084UBL0_9HYPH|nr:hypothetical protein [Nitratireductor basaltis]KFB10346.1 hypothetical protein EL18_01377 [Nitratireductor basaltis]
MSKRTGRGRPEFEPSDEQREKVRVLRASGMSQEEIAEALDISVPTLRKHFSFELKIGSAKVTADVLMARYRSAMGGNVSAQNKMLEQLGAATAEQKVKQRETKAPKLGKKEEQQIAAQNVGGKFAPPTPPKLVVDNR